ncbi:MAG: DNA polymerase Y family protein [Janthinobacterium lividum]
MKPIYLAVHVPEFPAQALLRLRPELARKAVAVLNGAPPLQRVCSTNLPARTMGVHAGMTRAQLDIFDGLHVLPASSAEETCARNALLEAAAVFTPRIEPQTATGPAFAMVLDMAGTQWMWGDMASATQRIRLALQALKFTVRLAASSSVHASLCLASVPQRTSIIVTNGQEAKALAPLPLSVLGLTQQLADTFTLWGLHTLGELAALPAADVVARLGKAGRRLHALACGGEPYLLVPEEPVFLLEEKIEFDAPVEQLESLLFVLRPMLDQLICRASSRSCSLASVTVCTRLDGGGQHMRSVRPALPTADCQALLKLLQLDLQTHPPGAGVLAMDVTAEPGDRLPVQAGFFAPQLPESMRLDVTLARIAALVGEQHVGWPSLLDTHGERSFAMKPFVVSEAASRTPSTQSKETVMSVRRCRPPVALRVYTQRKRHGQRPLSFYLHGQLYTVGDSFGPWRRSGDWWSSEVWSHEEWDVHAHTSGTTSGPEVLLCVLRHDLLRNQWTMEGLYD